MIKLDVITSDDPNFHCIDAKDIHRKNTAIKRSVGDSYHPDGRLWWLKMPEILQTDSVTTQGAKQKSELVLS